MICFKSEFVFVLPQRGQLSFAYTVCMQTRKLFIPSLVLAILALVFALWAGLLRLGWSVPSFSGLALAHGPLMVSGFLGVLIPLERAVAIGKKWMLAVPILTGLGWVFLLIFPLLGALLLTLGSGGTLAILGYMVRREPKTHTITIAAGVLAWLVGNVLWLCGLPIFQIVFWWLAFLILTIAGERLELSRILRPTLGQIRIFVIAAAALLAGAILALFDLAWGARLSGLAMLVLSLWFLKNDIATRNIRHPLPLTRYIAFCLVSGFIWLGVAGGFQLYFGALYAGPYYDAALHSVFVGFVISMIFGHALIIFPGILGVPVTFSRAFYSQLVLLHLSLLLRISGDLFSNQVIRQWGGLLNEITILLFLGMTARSLLKARGKA
jgi:hypothetical protein